MPTISTADDLRGMQAGVFFIEKSCYEHPSESGWSQFPGSKAEYIRAATAVSKKMVGCLTSLNPDAGDELAHYIKRVETVTIKCQPTESILPRECAHVVAGYREIILTSPKDCGGLENTIFHELLHIGTMLRNLSNQSHNDAACRRFDAIYACSEICFPSKPTLAQASIGWVGCRACVTEEKASARICGSLTPDFSGAFQECGPKGF